MYELYQRADHTFWFKCHECGHGAGYATEERCRQMAEVHTNLPHDRP